MPLAWLNLFLRFDRSLLRETKRKYLSFEAATARVVWALLSSTTQRTENAFGYCCFFALQPPPQFFFRSPVFISAPSLMSPLFYPSFRVARCCGYCCFALLTRLPVTIYRVSRADWPLLGFPFLIHRMRYFFQGKTVG